MRIGIVTQPLVANYGGLLQNYALQKALREMGCNPITLDLETHLNVSYIGYLKEIAKLFVKRNFLGYKRNYPAYKQKRPVIFDEFVRNHINTTQKFTRYTRKLILDYHLDGVIVGSDQVWRPRFNVYPYDMFLAFTEGTRIKRASYAASFGVGTWEYDQEMTERCSELVSCFDAVSVREASGVYLSKEYLGVDAIKVLDPTLLHEKAIYNELCKSIPRSEEQYIAVYALGLNEYAKEKINSFAKSKGLAIKYFTSDANYTLSVPEWVAAIRDATFVITDSFHGTAFSIIYNKDFYSIINKTRGTSRFESILADFELSDRLLDSTQLEIPDMNNTIDWACVNEKRKTLKEQSMEFLHNVLFG